MIHFWYSISISINDTFQVYQYHKSLIHDCDSFTGIQNSLLTKFAISVMNSWSRVSTTVSRILIPHHARYRQIVKLKTIWLRHSAINWLSNQCCRQEMYQPLEWHWHWTENAVKTQSNLESGKFSSNSTQLGTIAAKKLFSTAGQIEVPRHNHLSDSMVEKLLLMTANHSLFYKKAMLSQGNRAMPL